MGLFDFMKKTETKTPAKQNSVKNVNNSDLKISQRQTDLDYQNALLSRVNTAREKYKEDKDLESAIKEYEFAFVKSNPPCKTSQDIDLANLYIKAEQYDKAWGYLNQLVARRNYPDPEIKFYQAKILKKEEKYAYAIEMYAIGYYYKSIPNETFQAEKFKKDISSSAKKLGWDQERIDKLVNIIIAHPHKDNLEEEILIKDLREYMSEFY